MTVDLLTEWFRANNIMLSVSLTKTCYSLLPWQPAGIKFTHRPKTRFVAPQGRLVAPIHVKLGRADGHVGPLPVQNFTSIATGGENAAQKMKNFHFLVKSRPADSLGRFRKF